MPLRFAFLLLALLGTGCSRLEWGFRFADSLVFYQLDGYFHLEPGARDQAQAEFNRNLNALKKDQFLKVAEELDQFGDLSQKQLQTEAKFFAFVDRSELFIKDSIKSFGKLAQALVNEEAKNDFKNFDAKFWEKFNEDEKELQESLPKRLVKEQERAQDLVKETISYLTDAQLRDLKETFARTPPPIVLQLASRKQVFEKFKSLRMDPKTRAEFVTKFTEDWLSLQTPEYRKAREDYHTSIRALSYRVYASLNQDQRDTLKKKLHGRAKELRAIAATATE